MKVSILGVGIWGPGMCSYDDLCALSQDQTDASLAALEFTAPKPQAIAARERRRAGLMINLAVEVAHQACAHAGVDVQEVPSVFVSAMGDTDITDYMCRKLSQPEKLLSPTKFHNSVHNAPSGYWSISAHNHAPSTFVGGYTDSFGAGLLEAVSQAHAWHTPVLLVAYDIANRSPFAEVTPVKHSFACALVIAPAQHAQSLGGSRNSDFPKVEMDVIMTPERSNATRPNNEVLAQLAQANPAAAGLGLLEKLTCLAGLNPQTKTGQPTRMTLPAATHMSLQLTLRSV
jgi:beta-ketoacyl synthase-like protein